MSYWYRDGSVAVTNGSANVVGTDTLWDTQASVGDVFVGPDTLLYEITSITDATHMAVKQLDGVAAYAGATASAQGYAIIRNFTGTLNATIAARVSDLLNRWHTREDEWYDWHNGTVNGGPNNDGTYPFTDPVGATVYISCPAKLEAIANPHNNTAKTTLADDDELNLSDSADSWALKKITWTNVKAVLATWLETLTATWSNKTLDAPTITGGSAALTGPSSVTVNSSSAAYTLVQSGSGAVQDMLAGSDTATLGSELVTNGSFTGSATGWTLGTNWSYGTDNVVLTLDGATEGALAQSISVVSGALYLVEWSQTHSAANNGTLTPAIGAVNGISVCPTGTSAATMSQIIAAAATGSVTFALTPTDATSSGTITVDSITVKQLTPIGAATVMRNASGSVVGEARHHASSTNVSNGYQAGRSLTTGTSNTNNGYQAGYSLTTGTSNTNNGYQAGRSLTTGANNTNNGYQAGYSLTTGASNTNNGLQAGYSLTTGTSNTNNGLQAGYSLTTGASNTNNGYQAGRSLTTGANNTNNGYQAGYSLTTGASNTNNGYQAGYSLTTGASNTNNGLQAGRYHGAGTDELTTSTYCVFVGRSARASADAVTNEIVIGYNAVGAGSNTATLGNTTTTLSVLPGKVRSIGSYNATTASAANVNIDASGNLARSTSSIRYKTDIETLESQYADSVIFGARPVWYRSICEADPANWGFYGLIAEELAEIDPRLVHWGHPPKKIVAVEATPARAEVLDASGNVVAEAQEAQEAIYAQVPDVDAPLRAEGVQYDRLTVMLIDVVQRQQKRLDELEARIAALI